MRKREGLLLVFWVWNYRQIGYCWVRVRSRAVNTIGSMIDGFCFGKTACAWAVCGSYWFSLTPLSLTHYWVPTCFLSFFRPSKCLERPCRERSFCRPSNLYLKPCFLQIFSSPLALLACSLFLHFRRFYQPVLCIPFKRSNLVSSEKQGRSY